MNRRISRHCLGAFIQVGARYIQYQVRKVVMCWVKAATGLRITTNNGTAIGRKEGRKERKKERKKGH
jgi:urease beta subunit